MRCKKIVILGSTGSIGINTLKIIQRHSKQFKVVGLSAYNNFKLLEKQIKIFQPSYVAVSDKGMSYLKKNVAGNRTKILSVNNDLEYLASLKDVDIVVIAMRGSAALKPFLSAVRAGKMIAPANKEALVVAGEILMSEAKKYEAQIIPIDSEQSAIFQCLKAREGNDIKKIHLTASGGALLDVDEDKFDQLRVAEILKHPRWKMGAKITVDSAMLMNKGFEVIEAQRLFDLKISDIEVVVHPEAIIHSMVEFCDGSILAQLGITDMRIPIQYALSYPHRLSTGLKGLDFVKLKSLTFQKPNLKKFPSLSLAFHVAKKGGTLPSVLNGSDEVAVDAYLEGKIKFTKIYKIVEKIVKKHKIVKNPSLKDINNADQWSREEAQALISL